jgi:ribosomal protein S27E
MQKKSIKELQKEHKQSNKIMKSPFEEFRCSKCKNKRTFKWRI